MYNKNKFSLLSHISQCAKEEVILFSRYWKKILNKQKAQKYQFPISCSCHFLISRLILWIVVCEKLKQFRCCFPSRGSPSTNLLCFFWIFRTSINCKNYYKQEASTYLLTIANWNLSSRIALLLLQLDGRKDLGMHWMGQGETT